MLLCCPHCQTGFWVATEALGEIGRIVRCARCRGSWLAVAEPIEAEFVMAEADGAQAVQSVNGASDQLVSCPEPSIVEIESSPSIAVDQTPTTIIDHEIVRANSKTGQLSCSRNLNRSKRSRAPRFVLAAIGMLGILIVALVSREAIVRLVPDFAGLYAAMGIPVNLRGLEFRDVKTAHETQDGIPVLVIEGNVVNVVKHPVELPRVRLAVLGSNGQELYSWTTLLQRSILADNEKVSFRSRLASPPPEGREVLVRFVTRSDFASSIR